MFQPYKRLGNRMSATAWQYHSRTENQGTKYQATKYVPIFSTPFLDIFFTIFVSLMFHFFPFFFTHFNFLPIFYLFFMCKICQMQVTVSRLSKECQPMQRGWSAKRTFDGKNIEVMKKYLVEKYWSDEGTRQQVLRDGTLLLQFQQVKCANQMIEKHNAWSQSCIKNVQSTRGAKRIGTMRQLKLLLLQLVIVS